MSADVQHDSWKTYVGVLNVQWTALSSTAMHYGYTIAIAAPTCGVKLYYFVIYHQMYRSVRSFAKFQKTD